ncbi:MAG: hypothetical protein M0Z76_10185 [Gammaproteobacteria bacterium]|nr:hypothetical protein [Gammaproteobacteria bacterium]
MNRTHALIGFALILASGLACAQNSSSAGIFLRAGLPPASAARLTRWGARAHLAKATYQTWARIFRAVKREGVPPALLASRAFEGLLKGVPQARLTAALRVTAHNLLWGARLVRQNAPRASLATPQAQAALNALIIARRTLTASGIKTIAGHGPLPLSRLTALVTMAADARDAGVGADQVMNVLRHARHLRTAVLAHENTRFVEAASRRARAAVWEDLTHLAGIHPSVPGISRPPVGIHQDFGAVMGPGAIGAPGPMGAGGAMGSAPMGAGPGIGGGGMGGPGM